MKILTASNSMRLNQNLVKIHLYDSEFKTDGETNPVIANWMRKVDTLVFLKLWEQINNINFKPTDFEGLKSKQGENAFTILQKMD